MFPDRRSLVSPTLLALTGALWTASVAVGFAISSRYAVTPGSVSAVPGAWPPAASVARDPQRATLLVFAHPHCPCTRATIGELERIASRCGERANITVLFFDPGLGESWTHGELWSAAAAIPGVRIAADLDGRAAQLFGVHTSGHALCYAPDGRMVFEGGITALRGHAGDNVGEDSIVSWIESGAAERASTPAYGCRLDACDAAVPEVACDATGPEVRLE